MTEFPRLDEWLRASLADADRRGLPALKPLLETLAQAIHTLRRADFMGRADGDLPRRVDD